MSQSVNDCQKWLVMKWAAIETYLEEHIELLQLIDAEGRLSHNGPHLGRGGQTWITRRDLWECINSALLQIKE